MSAERAFAKLRSTYLRRPLVIFAGAGATMATKDSKYGVGTWRDLLDIVTELAGLASFGERATGGTDGQDPIADAEEILDRLRVPRSPDSDVVPEDAEQRLADLICRAITGGELRRPVNLLTKGTDKRPIKMLPKAFLEAAPTMNAIVSLCGQLVATRGAPGKEVRFRVEPNRRIRAIVTPNFDPYLEAAASRKYKRDLLKAVAAVDSSAGTHRQVPVYHVHGYVPFERSSQAALRRRLILTRSDYESERGRADAYSPALGPQIHFLRHYPTLFLGYSFTDEWLNDTLQTIQGDRRSSEPLHFAIVPKAEFSNRSTNLSDRFGVTTIEIDEFDEIPKYLGRLAQAGWRADGDGPVELQDETAHPSHDAPRGDRAIRVRRHRFSGSDAWSILMALQLGALPNGSEVDPFLA